MINNAHISFINTGTLTKDPVTGNIVANANTQTNFIPCNVSTSIDALADDGNGQVQTSTYSISVESTDFATLEIDILNVHSILLMLVIDTQVTEAVQYQVQSIVALNLLKRIKLKV